MDVKGTRVDVDASRLKAEIQWNGREITNRYLSDSNIDGLFQVIFRMVLYRRRF